MPPQKALPKLEDITVTNVVCSDITVCRNGHNDNYIMLFSFDHSSGLLGLLFSKIRALGVNEPLFPATSNECLKITRKVRVDMPIKVPENHSITAGEDKLGPHSIGVSKGLYTVELISQFKPVMCAVTDIVFRNIHLSQRISEEHEMFAVHLDDIVVDITSGLEIISWDALPSCKTWVLRGSDLVEHTGMGFGL